MILYPSLKCCSHRNLDIPGIWWHSTTGLEADTWCTCEGSARNRLWSTQLNSHRWFLTEVLDWFVNRSLNYFTDHKHTINVNNYQIHSLTAYFNNSTAIKWNFVEATHVLIIITGGWTVFLKQPCVTHHLQFIVAKYLGLLVVRDIPACPWTVRVQKIQHFRRPRPHTHTATWPNSSQDIQRCPQRSAVESITVLLLVFHWIVRFLIKSHFFLSRFCGDFYR